MTTRAERLDKAAARAKAALDVQRKALAQIQAAQHDEERKALTKRRLLVGTMADAAGLLALSDSDLAALFALVASIAQAAHPLAVVDAVADALLQDAGDQPPVSLHGCASPAESVSTAC